MSCANQTCKAPYIRVYLFPPNLFCTEEVFAIDHALWWSPDSRRLLYVGFDDSNVEPYSFPIYGDMEEEYTTTKTISYPKVRRGRGRGSHVMVM